MSKRKEKNRNKQIKIIFYVLGLIVIALFLPLINAGLMIIYSNIAFIPIVSYYDQNTPVTMFESTSIIISVITLIITTILTILTYRINKMQFEMLENINNTNPIIKMYPSKISFTSNYEDNIIFDKKYNLHTFSELKEIKDVKELIEPELKYPTSIMLELMIYNEAKNGVGTIVSNIYLKIYKNNELVGNKIYADKIINKDIKRGGKNYKPESEFAPVYVESQNVFQGIIQFEIFNEQLEETKEYKIKVVADTPDGEFVTEFSVDFYSLKTTMDKEERKIIEAIDFAQNNIIRLNGKAELIPIFKIDLLLRGKGEFENTKELRHRFKFSNTFDCKIKQNNK